MVWNFAVGSLIADGDENPNWPDCHQVQCAQLHETLDSLLDLLGCKCPKRVYTVGKMVHICEALRAKDAEIEMLHQQNAGYQSAFEAGQKSMMPKERKHD